MPERNDAGATNLTGVWNGLYTYANGTSVSFVATLIETESALSGTTHEPCIVGDCPNDTLYATLLGRRQDSAVTFTKSYDAAAGPLYGPVEYEGTLSGDGTEIEGRWTLSRGWSGKFLMIRSAGKTATRARKEVQRA